MATSKLPTENKAKKEKDEVSLKKKGKKKFTAHGRKTVQSRFFFPSLF